MTKKKILILGGEGFIGKNIADFLSRFYSCYSVDAKRSIFEKKSKHFIKNNPYKEGIVNNFNAVIHLIDNPVSISKFEKEEKNLIKNININSNNHLIVLSSAVVYANPGSDYGKRKIALERIYIDYCQKNNIKLIILRLFNVYGPYQLPNRQGSLVANLICNHLNRKGTEINDLNAKRDLFFSQDLGKFVHHIIKYRTTGTLDLATNRLTSLKKLIALLEEGAIKNKLRVIDKKNKETLRCPSAKNILLKKIKITPTEVGLKETLSFYKNNLNKVNKLSN